MWNKSGFGPRGVAVALALLAVALQSFSVLGEAARSLKGTDLEILKHFPPRSLEQLLEQRDLALRLAKQRPAAVLAALSATYIAMQAFAIPGTLSLSILAGALYGAFNGWILVAIISTLGSCSCYLLSRSVGRPLAARLWPEKLEFFAGEVNKRRSRLFNYILFLRLSPLLPNTFINVASPLVSVPFMPFFLGTLLGCLPNNWLACSAGSRLGELRSLSDLFDWHMVVASAGVGLVVLMAPAWLGKKGSRSGEDPDPGGGDDDPPLSRGDIIFYSCAAAFLVLMAGLMSGLTLGLMSLDQVDLEVLKRSGTTRQRACAEKILPVVAKPHRLLVTLLICNAVAAEALPLVLDRLTDPISAVILSVTVVLIFGEIVPQAACSAYGLEIGAHSALFVRVLMFLTAPLAVPIAWMLDRVLGHRQTALFRRGELKALVDIHGEGQAFGGHLTSDEVRIIKGALDLTHKRARAAMTPLDMAFMLPLDATLDEITLTGILASGHSRIPVHRPGNRSDIVGILLVKELILVDIHAGVKVSSMKVRSLPHLLAETPMYDMLKLFELGRSHMAVLTQPTREALARLRAEAHEVAIDIYSISDGDFGSSEEDLEREDQAQRRVGATSSDSDADSEPDAPRGLDIFSIKFEPHELDPVGIITIEDVLEELLGAEIVDETDNYVDNLGRTRVNAAAMARSLPPHLRKVLAGWGLTPRVGPALQVYRMASSTGGGDGIGGSRRSSLAAADGVDGSTFAAHLPRVGDQRRRSSSAAALNPVGFLSARHPPRGNPRRSTNISQGVQDQLDLLQPLIDARDRRFMGPNGAAAEGVIAEGEDDEMEPEIGSLRRENSI